MRSWPRVNILPDQYLHVESNHIYIMFCSLHYSSADTNLFQCRKPIMTIEMSAEIFLSAFILQYVSVALISYKYDIRDIPDTGFEIKPWRFKC